MWGRSPERARRHARIFRIKIVLLAQSALFAGAHAATIPGAGGPDVLIGPPTNDIFFGLGGDDRLVGDLFSIGEDIELPCRAGAGVEFQPVDGATGAGESLGNDAFSDGFGNDTVIGDAQIGDPQVVDGEFKDLHLFALAGTGAIFGGDGGDFNTAQCFSDSSECRDNPEGACFFLGGDGDDTWIGDVDHKAGLSAHVDLHAAAGSAALGRFAFFPPGDGGDGGDNNAVSAYNDIADFQFATGTKTLIGDVRGGSATGTDDQLLATAGSAGDSGGDGGDSNTVSAFNDRLVGGLTFGFLSPGQAQTIIGDDLREGGTGDVILVATAGAGGANPGGGDGGSFNAVQAFSDTLIARNGADTVVGDALLNAPGGDDLKFIVEAGLTKTGAGGTVNNIAAFNDTIDGSTRGDILVGDGWRRGPAIPDAVRIIVGGDAGNNISAFRDAIDGGNGNDSIHGDLKYDANVCDIDQFDVTGGFNGRSILFGDTINAGPGLNLVHGGFGADRMTGGTTRDTYVWYEPDITPLVGALPPVDLITNYVRIGPAFVRDRIDLAPILGCLGFSLAGGDLVTDWVRVSGTGAATTLDLDRDGPGGSFAFAPIANIPGLSGVTATALFAAGDLSVPP